MISLFAYIKVLVEKKI